MLSTPAASAVERFGRIDVLVNNAGVLGRARLEDVSDFGWYEDMMRVNYMGSVWCTRYALAELRKSKGLVAAIPGLAAKIGLPGYTGYSASKFAQAGFFEALRSELAGTGVDVTLVFADVVAINLFSHAYGADGKPAGTKAAKAGRAMPVEDCAARIVTALRGHRRELLTTPRAKALPWLKLLAPGIVQNMLHRPAARR